MADSVGFRLSLSPFPRDSLLALQNPTASSRSLPTANTIPGSSYASLILSSPSSSSSPSTSPFSLRSSFLSSRCFSRSFILNPLRNTTFSGVCVGRRKFRVETQARGGSVEYSDRLVAALGYFLPFMDGIQYGRYLFMRFPVLESLLHPLFPMLQVYKSIPYANFVLFFSLYLAVVRNPSFSRYVRFNTMQAVVLDVLLSIPIIIERILSPRRRLGIQLLVLFYNGVFVFLVACFLFGVVSCLLGKTPRLPFVADAADAQL